MDINAQLLDETSQWLATHGKINGTTFSEAGLLERITTLRNTGALQVTHDDQHIELVMHLAYAEMALRHTICELENFPQANNYGDACVVHEQLRELMHKLAKHNNKSMSYMASAIRTLEGMGYTWSGGEQWKPPIRQAA